MVVQQVDVFVAKFLTVHLLEAVGEHSAVEADEIFLGELAHQRRQIFVLDVGVGIDLTAGSRIHRVAIFHQEFEFLGHLAVFGVALAIEDVGLGHGVVPLGHERYLDLVLYLLDGHLACDRHPGEDIGEHVLGGKTADRQKSLCDSVLDFVHRERLSLAVPFDDVGFHLLLL